MRWSPTPSPGSRELSAPAGERWWQTRWWLALVVTGFPFAFGISAALVAVVAAPSTPGCGAAEEQLLVTLAHDFAAEVSGLRLGDRGGCDSGDQRWIAWEHASFSELRASAKAAGCRDAYLEDGDGDSQFMVCGEGSTRLLLSITPDPEDSGASGDISFER